MQKGVFNLSLFFLFFGGVDFVFLVSVFAKSPERPLSCNLRGSFSFVPPKTLSWTSCFSSSWSSSSISCVCPFKILSLLFFINPFWENILVLLLYLSLYFALSFLILCFHWNKILWHPLFKPKLLSCLAVWFFCVLIMFDFIMDVSVICLFLFAFVVSVVLLSACEQKRCFPCNSCVLGCTVGWKHVFQYVLDLVFVVFLVSEAGVFSVLSFCQRRHTRLVACFWILFFVNLLFWGGVKFCWFVFPYQETNPQIPELEKKKQTKPKMLHKSRRSFFQLAQLCAKTMLKNNGGASEKAPFAETTIQTVVSGNNKYDQRWSNVVSWYLVQVYVIIWSNYVAQHIWTRY